eukprot:486569-Rhodomonas_salina.1
MKREWKLRKEETSGLGVRGKRMTWLVVRWIRAGAFAYGDLVAPYAMRVGRELFGFAYVDQKHHSANAHDIKGAVLAGCRAFADLRELHPTEMGNMGCVPTFRGAPGPSSYRAQPDSPAIAPSCPEVDTCRASAPTEKGMMEEEEEEVQIVMMELVIDHKEKRLRRQCYHHQRHRRHAFCVCLSPPRGNAADHRREGALTRRGHGRPAAASCQTSSSGWSSSAVVSARHRLRIANEILEFGPTWQGARWCGRSCSQPRGSSRCSGQLQPQPVRIRD